ncbi:monocarboxylate transporter 12 [Dermacentor silvarum]|uniref:monocarboxylate transporter 12 n=1 Tax=Dermacentor silvarum TaxID=543639 RepID=UPI00189BAA50|nr:monocarboxylate transporter 12 [Dermacentor silvarum]XP_037571758.1 monocarboxylate transporter 12 [Dermacentor silvarum]
MSVDTEPKSQVPSGQQLLDQRCSVQSSSSSSSSSSGDGRCRRATPPDGGWGWVVVFASFMINLIADGVSMSFGILFVDLIDYFEQSKGKTAWVGSLYLSMPLLTGPIASSLTDRYGCRRVCIVGSLLAASGFVASYVGTSLEFLFLTFSVSGFGLALCYVTSIVSVAYYFERRRSLATGLAVCGTGIGTFVFAPLTIRLLETFAWQGTLLILAGFFLNMVLSGALMRDLDLFGDDDEDENGTDTHEKKTLPSAGGSDQRLCSSLIQLPTYITDQRGASLDVLSENYNKEKGHLNTLLVQHPNIWNTIDPSSTIKSMPPNFVLPPSKASAAAGPTATALACRDGPNGWGGERRLQQRADSACLRNMRLQRGSLTYRGAMLNIRRYRLRASSCPDIYRNSMLTISGEDKTCQWLSDLKEVLLDSMDVRLFLNGRYTLLCISNFLLNACVDIPYMYLPDSAIQLGVDKDRASYLISFIGILNTFGVVIVGYLGDKSWLEPTLLYSLLTAISGAAIAVLPMVSSYAALSLLSSVYGFAISANYTLVPVILVNLISLDNFTGAYGLLLLIQGVAGLMGPPIAGWLCDTTGAYDATFYFSGLSILASGVLMLPVASSWRCQNPASFNHRDNDSTSSSSATAAAATTAERRKHVTTVLLPQNGANPAAAKFGEEEGAPHETVALVSNGIHV